MVVAIVFFLMSRRPQKSTLSSSSAASDVYKRQLHTHHTTPHGAHFYHLSLTPLSPYQRVCVFYKFSVQWRRVASKQSVRPVSYTHLRAHETPEHLVCRLLLEKKKKIVTTSIYIPSPHSLISNIMHLYFIFTSL
eukprot:TRINITY_DN13769_c0_g1_i1.p1 TRINITY_DN13769_c0_g1~~TRINITY_DN13769_c0_g1_i1.p1  ORF type:complete len:135 (+),score=15.82 TRINITY_DN13769_c0_g1_i1:95-499(+)